MSNQHTHINILSYPKFVKIVLKGRASDKHAVLGDKNTNNLRKHGVLVFDTMRLINDDVLPRDFFELRLLLQAGLIRRNADFEIDVFQARVDQLLLQ